MSDLVFAADAETTMAIAPETQVRMLESLVRFEIEAFERVRATAGRRSTEAASMTLRREEALQDTLRRALWLGDRDVARAPLRHVAEQLEIDLDESDEDWSALAYEATKVLLDVSQERGRRQQGIYDQPTVFFRRAVSTVETASAPHRTAPADITVAPASFATDEVLPEAAPVTVPASFACETETPVPPVACPEPTRPQPEPQNDAAVRQKATACEASLRNTTSLSATIVVPASFDMPSGYDEERWQEARIAARPPRILIDRSLLSESIRAALEKQRGITLTEAIELYFELLSWGYRAPFNKHQKRKAIPEKLKTASVDERLCEDHRGKRRLALDFWPSALGDEPVDEIHVDEVNDALQRFWGVPANHGRSANDRANYGIMELIEMADARAAQLDKDIEAAELRGAGSEEIDKMRLQGHKARVSVTTYIKHGRVMRGRRDADGHAADRPEPVQYLHLDQR
ncbi:hypothetical protein [Jannaschia seosinensis]|nr:hypothetical protein [Jannaschia seosinensis]